MQSMPCFLTRSQFKVYAPNSFFVECLFESDASWSSCSACKWLSAVSCMPLLTHIGQAIARPVVLSCQVYGRKLTGSAAMQHRFSRWGPATGAFLSPSPNQWLAGRLEQPGRVLQGTPAAALNLPLDTALACSSLPWSLLKMQQSTTSSALLELDSVAKVRSKQLACFQVVPSCVTVVAGPLHSGKTDFVFELLTRLSSRHAFKAGLCLLESQVPEIPLIPSKQCTNRRQ